MKENLILVSTPMQRREKLMFNKKNTVLNNNMQKYIFFQIFRMTLHFTINLKFTNGARIRRVIGVILIMLTLYKDYLMKAFSN